VGNFLDWFFKDAAATCNSKLISNNCCLLEMCSVVMSCALGPYLVLELVHHDAAIEDNDTAKHLA
jgi:hypothetical protein